MSMIEIEEAHFYSAMSLLEEFVVDKSNIEHLYCDRIGIVRSITNYKTGEHETYAIIFEKQDDISSQHKFVFSKIPNGSLKDRTIMYLYGDKGQMVTDSALCGFDIVNSPFEDDKKNEGDDNE